MRAALYYILYLLFASLQLSRTCHGHLRESCKAPHLPVVVLQKIPNEDYGGGIETNTNFTVQVVGRYDASQIDEAIEDWSNATARRRHLEAWDYTVDRQGEKIFPSPIDQSSHVRSSTGTSSTSQLVPALRVLHTGHYQVPYSNVTDNLEVNQEVHIESNFFLVRECSCFRKENYESVFCPFATNKCAQVINNHYKEEGSRFHPELVMCFADTLKNADQSTYRYLWLMMFAAWGSFFAAVFLTHSGRSCLSYIPSQLTKRCGFQWNEKVADFLLRYRPERATAMIRTNVLITRRRMNLEYMRTLRRQQQQQQQQSTASYQEGQGNVEMVVANNNNNENEETQTEPRRPPTALALKTKIYRDSITLDPNISESHGSNDEDCMSHPQCAICLSGFVAGQDRVGVLPCQHTFHVVPCLKGWLARGNNSCPFCRTKNVAVERYDVTKENDEKEDAGEQNDSSTLLGGLTEAIVEPMDSINGSESQVSPSDS